MTDPTPAPAPVVVEQTTSVTTPPKGPKPDTLVLILIGLITLGGLAARTFWGVKDDDVTAIIASVLMGLFAFLKGV